MLGRSIGSFWVLLCFFLGLSSPQTTFARDWVSDFKNAKFEGQIPDCQDGTVWASTECTVVLEFDRIDGFGGLLGTLDLGLSGQVFEVKFEYFPQSDDPYRWELSSASYSRRLKAKEPQNDWLHFFPPGGDGEPTQLQFSFSEDGQTLTIMYRRSAPLKGVSYMVYGDLRRK